MNYYEDTVGDIVIKEYTAIPTTMRTNEATKHIKYQSKMLEVFILYTP